MHSPSRNRNLIVLWALAAGIIVSAFAMSLQIDLWVDRGKDWNGSFAVVDYDEPFYAAYIQSLIDGKPIRNSPFTGVRDSDSSPQKDSYLSIQFLSSEPVAVAARLFGLSASTAMIILAPVIGFLSAIALFWLLDSILESPAASFALTLLVLLCGGLIAGQGGVSRFISPDTVHYSTSFLFLRRSVPAMSFPALILFFVFIWKLFTSGETASRIISVVLSVFFFTFTVYGYFYHWTLAVGWLVVLVMLWSILRFDEIKTRKFELLALVAGMMVVLVPYVFLLLNRSTEADSALVLKFTHQPDLLRLPCIVCYVTIVIVAAGVAARLVDLRPASIFLLSAALVPLAVFNQQIFTGRSLQPFHYQLFGANYIALFALVAIIFLILKERCSTQILNAVTGFVCVVALFIGFFDASFSAGELRGLNKWRDELYPVGQRIREMETETPTAGAVLSFDFVEPFPINAIELPAVSSQPIVWEPHLLMFPDTNSQNALARLNTFLYYQNLDAAWVSRELRGGNNLLAVGFFGGIRSNDPSINESERPSPDQISDAVNQYARFHDTFSYETAAALPLGYVVVRKDNYEEDFATVDKWYDRDEGEAVGPYVIYRISLRKPLSN